MVRRGWRLAATVASICARALAPSPALLLADEPTGNLDQETGQAVMDLLFRQAVASGATLLLVTHDPGLAGRCGRCVHIADGRVVPIERAALASATA